MRRSLRSQLQQLLLFVVINLAVGMFAAVGLTLYLVGQREVLETRARLEGALDDKGQAVTKSYAISLRSLVVEHAFSDVDALIHRAVSDDADAVLGSFTDVNGKVWVKATKSEHVDTAKRVTYSEAVTVDGETLGTVEFVLSTERVEALLATAIREKRLGVLFAFGILVLVTLLFVAGAFAIARKKAATLTAPLAQLTTAAHALARGERQLELHVKTGDEIEVLSLAFTQMVDELNASYASMKALNSELSHALKATQESAKAKSEFLANTSHELRTPLNAIINLPLGLLEAFVDHKVSRCAPCAVDYPQAARTCPVCGAPLTEHDARQLDFEVPRLERVLKSVAVNGQHLLSVVNDILDFSKIDSGRLTISKEPAELNGLLADLEAAMALLADQQKVKLVVTPLATPIVVEVDRLRFMQVLINLVGNAIKFSDGKGTVWVSAKHSNESVEVSIRDQGIGIAAENHQLIFESFRQVERGNTRRFGGTGLGLAVSMALMKLHGGTIHLESTVGAGSTFTAVLPLVQPTGAPA